MTEAASVYVGVWTKKETQKLLATQPVIVPVKSGYKVGKYSVKSSVNGWEVHDSWGELVKTFTGKKSAVYWSVLTGMGRVLMSQKLYDQDTRLSKYTQDQLNYTHMRQRSLSKKDYFSVDLCNARLAKNESMLEDARIELEKTLNSAKYLKGIWD